MACAAHSNPAIREAEWRVPVYIHMDHKLADIGQHYPTDHYAPVDDKKWLLTAFTHASGERLTTVLPRRVFHAHDPDVATYAPPDVTVGRSGELLGYDALNGSGHVRRPA